MDYTFTTLVISLITNAVLAGFLHNRAKWRKYWADEAVRLSEKYESAILEVTADNARLLDITVGLLPADTLSKAHAGAKRVAEARAHTTWDAALTWERTGNAQPDDHAFGFWWNRYGRSL